MHFIHEILCFGKFLHKIDLFFRKSLFSRFSIDQLCCSTSWNWDKNFGLNMLGSIGARLMLDWSNLFFDRSKLNFDQRYGYHSVPARKFHIGKQTGTTCPSIPPRVRFRLVSVCFGSSGLFRLISPEIKDSACMSLLHIKLNLGVLVLHNRPKSFPSFLSTNTL